MASSARLQYSCGVPLPFCFAAVVIAFGFSGATTRVAAIGAWPKQEYDPNLPIVIPYRFSIDSSPRAEFERRFNPRVPERLTATLQLRGLRRSPVAGTEILGAVWTMAAPPAMPSTLHVVLTSPRDRSIDSVPSELAKLNGKLLPRLDRAAVPEPRHDGDSPVVPFFRLLDWSQFPMCLGQTSTDDFAEQYPTALRADFSPAASNSPANDFAAAIDALDSRTGLRSSASLPARLVGVAPTLPLTNSPRKLLRPSPVTAPPLRLNRPTSGAELLDTCSDALTSFPTTLSFRAPFLAWEEWQEWERRLSSILSAWGLFGTPHWGIRYPDWYWSLDVDTPVTLHYDFLQSLSEALYSFSTPRSPPQADLAPGTTLELIETRRTDRQRTLKLPQWVAPIIRQDVDDRTIEIIKRPFEGFWRQLNAVYTST